MKLGIAICILIALQAIGMWQQQWLVPMLATAISLLTLAGRDLGVTKPAEPEQQTSQSIKLRSMTVAILIIVAAIGTAVVALRMVLLPVDPEYDTWVVPVRLTHAISELILLCQAIMFAMATYWHRSLPAHYATGSIILAISMFNRVTGPQDRWFFFAVASGIVLAAAMVWELTSRQQRRIAGSPWRTSFATALIMLLVIAAGGGCSYALSSQLDYLQKLFAEAIPDAQQTRSTTGYVTTGTLNSIRQHQFENPNHVALRIECQQVPGYISSRVFDTYAQRCWQLGKRPRFRARESNSLAPTQRQLPDITPSPNDPRRLFELVSTNSPSWRLMQIRTQPERGNVCFLPRNAAYIYAQPEGKTELIQAHNYGFINGGVNASSAYLVVSPEGGAQQEPYDYQIQRMLQLPDTLTYDVRSLTSTVTGQAKTTQAKVAAVCDFLRLNYEYSLSGFQVPNGMEPLDYFFTKRPAAHCEYFATAAIMMLRSTGIPCRYVTGYLVEEASEYEDYWIARNHSAHAWAEAYDQQNKRWLVVEATPGVQLDTNRELDISQLSSQSAGNNLVQDLVGYDLLWQIAGFIFATVVGVVCFVLLGPTVLAWVQLWWQERTQLSPQLQALRRRLRACERRLKRYRLVREPTETLHQFASRVCEFAAERDDAKWFSEQSQELQEYARLRYSQLCQ